VSEKEHDKEERVKTIGSDFEIKNENDPFPSPVVSGPIVTYKPRVLYPQALDESFPSKKYKQRDDILETFKQVEVNLPLLEAIGQIPVYAKFFKNKCIFKRKSKDGKSKRFLLSKQVSSILKFDTPSKFEDPGVPTLHVILLTTKLKEHFWIWVLVLI